MRYKIYYEPMYAYECKAILTNIVSGMSIKDEMEESIKKRSESLRSSIEPLFTKSLELEEYVKDNVCFNLPGYEESGHDMAEFLFKKWENADDAPINAIYYYDLLLSTGMDNKAVMIFSVINDDFYDGVWGMKEIEENIPPPFVDDKTFFEEVYKSQLDQKGKLKAMKLYYDFDSYRAYAHVLFQHLEDLLKSKISEYAADIKIHMDFIEEHLLANNVLFLENQISIEPNDDVLYHVYPGVYCANNLTFSPSSALPQIIIGISIFALEELFNDVEFDTEKAIQFLKCLSDNTKLTILQLLKNESLYGSQLAGKLDCTSANVSQHMNTLVNLGVVHIKKENNRVYFYLNKDAINGYLEAAKGLFI